jgi:hypothetical protein
MNKLATSIILVIIALIFVGYGMFSLGSTKMEGSFKVKLDSLNKVNDSLLAENLLDDKKVAELEVRDSILEHRVSHQKAKVVMIDRWIDSSKGKIDTYTEHELVSSFNNRYPAGTVTNPLPVAQPVLVSAAKDLVELDGAKEKLVIKDSVIATQESRITLKDSTITLFVNKEGRYKSIITNKDQAIAEWTKQYDILNLNYKKLQVKSKFQKLGSYIIIGGLAYTLLAK